MSSASPDLQNNFQCWKPKENTLEAPNTKDTRMSGCSSKIYVPAVTAMKTYCAYEHRFARKVRNSTVLVLIYCLRTHGEYNVHNGCLRSAQENNPPFIVYRTMSRTNKCTFFWFAKNKNNSKCGNFVRDLRCVS